MMTQIVMMRGPAAIVSVISVARTKEFGWNGRPIPEPRSYEQSQRHRKRVEEIFGWVKTVTGQAKTRFRGVCRVAASFTLAVAAYNLIRLSRLLAESAT